ncbi:MAG: zinc ribbon domain-containing protein [Candidatus Acidiferrales bacterium]
MQPIKEVRLAQTNDSCQAPVTIASISDQDWFVSRTYGMFHIPARSSGSSCSELIIDGHDDALDLGDNRRFPFSISAREIAEDLIQDLENHGVFVCAGAHPTVEEMARARDRRDVWYKQLIGEGDVMWARGHSFREISDQHRRAAIALGIEREWAYVPDRMSDCPACGEKVRTGVAVCRHCGAILDAERAAKLGISPRSFQAGSGIAAAGASAIVVPDRAVVADKRR